MASIVPIKGAKGVRWRALVRKGGHKRCMTFATRGLAKAWAAKLETEIEELKAHGFMKPSDLTVGELIDRYIGELYASKRWSVSKTNDLKALRRAFESYLLHDLDHTSILDAFTTMADAGTGGVGIGARMSYFITVLKTARDVWRLNVSVEAAQSARAALVSLGLLTASKERSRRVSDDEIARIIKHLEASATTLPMRDLIHFAVASALRVSEICALKWDDLNTTDRTVKVRDRKHPTKKAGNTSDVPLLDFSGHDAYAIVARQPKTNDQIFPYNPRTVGQYFREAAAIHEIEDLVFHDLRHEAVSRMFESKHKYSIPEVALVSGHRDWRHLRRYTNLRAVDLHR
jgi:integrase